MARQLLVTLHSMAALKLCPDHGKRALPSHQGDYDKALGNMYTKAGASSL